MNNDEFKKMLKLRAFNFLNHSLKSGNETKFWLALAKDLDAKLILEIEKLLKETGELVKILGSSIATLKGKNKL